jgi:hypothetical protein
VHNAAPLSGVFEGDDWPGMPLALATDDFTEDDIDETWSCRPSLTIEEVAHLLHRGQPKPGDCERCADIERKLNEAFDGAKEEQLEWIATAIKAANLNYVALLKAQARNSYVHSGPSLHQRTSPPFIRGHRPEAAGHEHWVGTGRVLAKRGIELQTVVATRPEVVGGGCSVFGYRLRPEGDDRGTVEFTEITG